MQYDEFTVFRRKSQKLIDIYTREAKMHGGKMRGGKRKWNCVSFYGMIGIDVCGGVRSKAA